jgi:hypothetical protein
MFSPILFSMFNTPEPRVCDYSVLYKGSENAFPLPYGQSRMRGPSLIVPCAERRAYLTFDIFRGRLSYRFHPEARPVRTGDLMGEMRRAIAAEETERRKHDRFASTLVIAASVIAAVRLAREDISRPSPRVASVVADSIALARTILDRIVR